MSDPDRRHPSVAQQIEEHARNCPVLAAFPRREGTDEPDLLGHCDAHTAQIRAARAQERFWEELKLDVAKRGAIGLLVVLFGLLLLGLGVKLHLLPLVTSILKD